MYLIMMISLFLSSRHEKATEALCIRRIQTRLGVALVSEFSAWILLLTSSICCLLDLPSWDMSWSMLPKDAATGLGGSWTINHAIMAVIKATLRTTGPRYLRSSNILRSCLESKCSHAPHWQAHQRRLASDDWMPASHTNGQHIFF